MRRGPASLVKDRLGIPCNHGVSRKIAETAIPGGSLIATSWVSHLGRSIVGMQLPILTLAKYDHATDHPSFTSAQDRQPAGRVFDVAVRLKNRKCDGLPFNGGGACRNRAPETSPMGFAKFRRNNKVKGAAHGIGRRMTKAALCSLAPEVDDARGVSNDDCSFVQCYPQK